MARNDLTIKCFICGNVGNFLSPSSKPFSATKITVGDKIGCICLDCLKKIYDSNRLFLSETTDEIPIGSKKQAVLRGSTVGASKKDSTLISMLRKWQCLDYSLESYIRLAETKIFGQSNAVQRTLFGLYLNQFANLIEELGHPSPDRKQIFMIGPTGVGKTYTATIAAKLMGIPFARSNAESITSAGYIGDKVEAIIERLVDAADGDMDSAEQGIIIIDEIDKIKKQEADPGRRDVNGLAVQQELLKVLEPSEVWINHHSTKFDTSRLTIILGGAFTGLEEIIRERLFPKKIGFTSNQNTTEYLLSKVKNCDLEKYGFIPEFLGRTPYPIVLDPLSYEAYLDIINVKLLKEDSIFKAKNFDLYVNPYAKEKIVRYVMTQKTGARDIRKEVDELLYPAEFQVLNCNSNGICEIDEYGTASILCTDRKTNRIEVKQYKTTLDYMLKDLPEDEEIVDLDEFTKKLQEYISEMQSA